VFGVRDNDSKSSCVTVGVFRGDDVLLTDVVDCADDDTLLELIGSCILRRFRSGASLSSLVLESSSTDVGDVKRGR
jgi:hypothetical protein